MLDYAHRPVTFLVLSLGLNFPAIWYGLKEGFPRTLGYGSTAACPTGNRWLFWNTLFIILHLSVVVHFLIEFQSRRLCNPMRMFGADEDEDDESAYAEARANVASGPISDYTEATDDPESTTPTLFQRRSDTVEKGDLSMFKRTAKPYLKPDVLLYGIVTGMWALWQLVGVFRALDLGRNQGGACDNIQQWISVVLVCSLVYMICMGYIMLKMARQPHDDGPEW